MCVGPWFMAGATVNRTYLLSRFINEKFLFLHIKQEQKGKNIISIFDTLRCVSVPYACINHQLSRIFRAFIVFILKWATQMATILKWETCENNPFANIEHGSQINLFDKFHDMVFWRILATEMLIDVSFKL